MCGRNERRNRSCTASTQPRRPKPGRRLRRLSLQIAMLEPEQALFRSFLCCSTNYLEFGAGGSTVLAASLVGRSVIAVESSPQWITKVEQACAANRNGLQPT